MAENPGVIGPPVTVVVPGDERAGKSVPDARRSAAGPLVEIPRILFEDNRQYGLREDGAGQDRCRRRGVALGVPCFVAAKAAEVVSHLLNPDKSREPAILHRINDVLPGQLEL